MNTENKRSTKTLRVILHDEVDSVRDGSSTPQRARAIGTLVNNMLQTVRLEMEFTRFVNETQKGTDGNLDPVIL